MHPKTWHDLEKIPKYTEDKTDEHLIDMVIDDKLYIAALLQEKILREKVLRYIATGETIGETK